MPKPNVIVISRANFDAINRAACPFWNIIIKTARYRGFTVIDLKGDDATRAKVEDAIRTHDPICFLGLGHGSSDTFADQYGEVAFKACENDDMLAGRVVYLLSCLTGQVLGKSMIDKGCTAYLGYTKEVYFHFGIPELDWTFGMTTIVSFLSLAFGATTKEAYEIAVKWHNKMIDYWGGVNDPIVPIIVDHLVWNRDCLVLYGAENARITNKLPVKFFDEPLTPYHANYSRVKVVTWNGVNSVAGVDVTISYGEVTETKKTDSLGEATFLIPHTKFRVAIATNTSVVWEDGVTANPREFEISLADDMLLVATLTPLSSTLIAAVTKMSADTIVTCFTALMILTLLRAVMKG